MVPNPTALNSVSQCTVSTNQRDESLDVGTCTSQAPSEGTEKILL